MECTIKFQGEGAQRGGGLSEIKFKGGAPEIKLQGGGGRKKIADFHSSYFLNGIALRDRLILYNLESKHPLESKPPFTMYF